MTRRQERFESLIQKLAALFIEKNSEGRLVTVTNVSALPDFKKVTIYLTVLPEENEGETLASLQEKTKEFRKMLSEELKTRFIPEVEFILDPGRKTRELIDQLAK